jgi:hypothetical protein
LTAQIAEPPAAARGAVPVSDTGRELRPVYSVFYIIGVVVVVLMVLSFLGIH